MRVGPPWNYFLEKVEPDRGTAHGRQPTPVRLMAFYIRMASGTTSPCAKYEQLCRHVRDHT